jgi:hypothetical protein
MGSTIHTNEILNKGMNCLTEELGIVEAQRFISIIKREQIDYAKWQDTYFNEIASNELNETNSKYVDE